MSGDYNEIVLPEIPNDDKPVIVIDDIIGQQARMIAKELESRGHVVNVSDLKPFSSPSRNNL